MSKAETYAVVEWQAEDVRTLKPLWTIEECTEWLVDNEGRISDRLIELGWEVLDVLVRETSYDEEEDDE